MRKDTLALVPYAAGMDDVEVRELRYFIAVAEELSFTRAAQRLGMAQPPLSAAIGKLEHKLGVRLLDRTSRRVLLTPAGAMLLSEGRTAVENLGAVVQRVRRQAKPDNLLTVVVKAGDGTGLVKQIARRCAADPQIPEVRIMFSRAGAMAAAVRDGVADAAILRAPFDPRPGHRGAAGRAAGGGAARRPPTGWPQRDPPGRPGGRADAALGGSGRDGRARILDRNRHSTRSRGTGPA
jgi:DNA-binding transcriptional LysR family regulator